MSYKIRVDYDGKYPNLCRGVWSISINDKTFKTEAYSAEHFNTFGSYERWRFIEDWDVEWETYTDGLMFEDWIKEIKSEDTNGLFSWIKENYNSTEWDNILNLLYPYIQSKDFRSASCGGCI